MRNLYKFVYWAKSELKAVDLAKMLTAFNGKTFEQNLEDVKQGDTWLVSVFSNTQLEQMIKAVQSGKIMTCDGKVRYDISQEPIRGLTLYFCPFCMTWHLGHAKNKKIDLRLFNHNIQDVKDEALKYELIRYANSLPL